MFTLGKRSTLKNFVFILLILGTSGVNAAEFGNFVLESSPNAHQLQIEQNGNKLSFHCDNKQSEIQTILNTQHFFAYSDDPSLLIFELNGVQRQLSGDGSGSMFKSCFNCDNDDLHTLLDDINSSVEGTLNLEAISLSSGISSRVSFEIKSLEKAIFELQKSCHQLSVKNTALQF